MKTYSIYETADDLGLINAPGSMEESACEIFCCFHEQDIESYRYFSVLEGDLEFTYAALKLKKVASISLDRKKQLDWINKFKPIYVQARNLSKLIVYSSDNILEEIHKLETQLKLAPNLNSFEFTNSDGMHQILELLSTEITAYSEIACMFHEELELDLHV